MTRARLALLLATGLILLHLGMRALGLAVHLSALVGMPEAGSSLTIALAYVGVYLLAIMAAPALVLAALLELIAGCRRNPPRRLRPLRIVEPLSLDHT